MKEVGYDIKGELTAAYFKLVMNETTALIHLDQAEEQDVFGRVIANVILRTGPTRINKKANAKETFISNKIFRPMAEILDALWAIENIAIYIRSFPYKRHRISPLNYLQYNIESYLNEIYILKARLISYLNTLEKAYGKDKQAKLKINKIKYLRLAIKDAFKKHIVARSKHVHVSRYIDQDLERLSTLHLFSFADDEFGKLMKIMFLSSYKASRKKWVAKIKKDTAEIEKLLNFYFGELTKILFKDEQLMVPDIIKNVMDCPDK